MKKILLPMIALVIGIALSAFTSNHLKSRANKAQTTYVYTGDNTIAQQRLAQNYLKDNDALPCSGSEQKICLIVTDTDEGDNPDFSSGNPVDNPTMFDEVDKRPND